MRNRLLVATLIVVLSSQCLAQDSGLWDAIRRGQLSVVEQYLAAGGDPDTRVGSPTNDELQWPLLQIAIFDREEAIALAALRAGAGFSDLNMAVDLVVGEGIPDFLDELFSREPELVSHASLARQRELLYPAASRGYYQVVEVVLDHARQLAVVWDEAILSEAVARALDAGQDDIARILIDAGAKPEGSVVHIAARASSPGMMQFLISLGGSPVAELPEDAVNPRLGLRTPMDFARRRYLSREAEQREAARYVIFELIRGGADSNADATLTSAVPRDGIAQLQAYDDAADVLIEAARMGYFDVVQRTLAIGRFEPDVLREALSIALRSLHNDIARLLIDARAPLDDGSLHAAAAGSSPGLVRLMLALGADANEVVNGRTPLESWWERSKDRYLRAAGEHVLHELINGGADACWLSDLEAELSSFAANFLRNNATECWP